MPLRLTGTGTALPAHRFTQRSLYAECLTPYFGGNARAERIFAHPAVETRHSVLADPAAFFAARPGAGARNAIFAEEAPALAARAAEACLARAQVAPRALDALVTATCTGYMTPGLDLLLASSLGMPAALQRFALGGMGCYAAFPALRLARTTLLAGTATRALVVATELCTLHFQETDDTDNVVASSLFADGASAVCLEMTTKPGWELVDMRTQTLYDTGAHMTWNLTDTGFRMHLSAYVPMILREAVGEWVFAWLAEHGLAREAIAHWALHPGGPRVLDGLQAALGLDDEALAPSREVLRTCGNMSSATAFFLLDRLAPRPGELAVMLAFGPGLTMEGALLRYAEGPDGP